MAKKSASVVIKFDANTAKSETVCFRIPAALNERMKTLRKRAEAAGGTLDFSPSVRAALQQACDDADAQLAALKDAA